MATKDLFAPQSEEQIRQAMRRAKKAARGRQDEEFDKAVDYLHNRQLERVREELQLRYRQTQSGDAGQIIEPVTVPIVERYAAEAATAYNRPFKRELVREDGEVDDDATQIFIDELEACGYNETMHTADRIQSVIGTCGIWYQARRGKLRPVITLPQHIYPVAPTDGAFFDAADQEDYQGHIVSVSHTGDDSHAVAPQSWAYLTPAEVVYYEARDPYLPDRLLSDHANPYLWPQVVDTDDQRGNEQMLPLQMLTFWHWRKPCDQLIPDIDAEVATLNHEINVQLSVLLDTMRVQGHGQLFMQLMNPEVPPKQFVYGSRFVLPLDLTENVGALNLANDYNGMINVLQTVVKLFAVTKSMSANDFAVDRVAPASGFSKLIDSLPQIQARNDRITRLVNIEKNIAWPRICSILQYLGKLGPEASRLRLRVEFSEPEFPRNVDEEARKQEHEFKHGLSSPAAVLAKRRGITEEEAADIIAENKGKPEPEQQQQPPQRQSVIGQLIGQRKSMGLKPPGKEKGED